MEKEKYSMYVCGWVGVGVGVGGVNKELFL